ncbi:MAG: ATP-binding protein, partial [Promethearchaeota archaeon]
METLRFLQPSRPDQFVGYRKTQTEFRSLLSKFKGNNLEKNGILIIGPPGFGKSSLLEVFRNIAKTERLACIQLQPKMGAKGGNIFIEIYKSLESRFEDKKKGRFRKGPKEASIPSVKANESPIVAINTIVENLAQRPLKEHVVFFIDSLDRLMFSGYENIIQGLAQLAERMGKERISALFVMTMLQGTYDALQNELPQFERFSLDRLDMTTAEQLLKRVGGDDMRNREFRRELLRICDKSPFALTFAADLTLNTRADIARERMETQGETAVEIEVSEIAERIYPILETQNITQYITQKLELTEDEIKVLSVLSNQVINLISLPDLQKSASLTNQRASESLATKKLLIIEEGFAQVSSNALFERLSIRTEADPWLQSELYITLINEELNSGFKPRRMLLNRLEKAVSVGQTGERQAKPLGSKAQEIFKTAFNRGLYFDAYRIALVGSRLFQKSGDRETAGEFLEDTARSFVDAEKPYYAKQLLEKALTTHVQEYKIRRCARDAADIFLDLGDEALKK